MMQLRMYAALLALVIVTNACGENPVRPTPVPRSNLVSILESSPMDKRVDKGRALDLLVHYELAQSFDLSAVPRLDAAGTATETRRSGVQRVGPGVGEIWLTGASVLLSSNAEETRYVEVTMQDTRNPASKMSVLLEWSVKWYWPIRIVGTE